MVRSRLVAGAFLLGLMAAPALVGQNETPPETPPETPAAPNGGGAPSESQPSKPSESAPAEGEPSGDDQAAKPKRVELDEHLTRDALKADNPGKYSYKSNVVFPQTLFDGEHLRAYERRGDNKAHAKLGSWSLDFRAAAMIAATDNSRDGWEARGRARFGPFGMHVGFTTLSSETSGGATGTQSLEDVFSLGFSLDLDFTEWFVARPVIGWTSLDHDDDRWDDDVVAYGIEFDFFPLKPFTIETSYLAYRSTAIDSTIHDGFIGVGFLPMLLMEENPTIHPMVRVGWRRIAGHSPYVRTSMIVIELSFGF